MKEPVRVFISYNHHEKRWKDHLLPLVKIHGTRVPGKFWHDDHLTAGAPWKREIEDELKVMDIFLCLVSHRFLASDFIMDIELKCARQRCKASEVVVVPILLEPIDLRTENKFLFEQQPLPAFDRPWSAFNPRSNAHKQIRAGIRAALEKVHARRKTTGLPTRSSP